MTGQPSPQAAAARAAFADAAAAVNALPPEEAFETAQDLVNEYRLLVVQVRDLRDVQVARFYDTGRMTLVELAAVTQWGADRTGKVTRGRMHQIVTRGRQLLTAAADGGAAARPSRQPAADPGDAALHPTADVELAAMASIVAALEQLDFPAQARVVTWLRDRYRNDVAAT